MRFICVFIWSFIQLCSSFRDDRSVLLPRDAVPRGEVSINFRSGSVRVCVQKNATESSELWSKAEWR